MNNKKHPFQLAASYTIGSYILPGKPIDHINQILNENVKVNINTCSDIIQGIKEGRFDLGLIETPIFDNALIYDEWIDNELVVCSKIELPNDINQELLSHCKLICRKENTPARELIDGFFQNFGIGYETFQSLSEVDNATAAIQSIKWTKPNLDNPTVTIVSRLAIEDELKRKELFESRINHKAMNHKFYIIHKQGTHVNNIIDNIISELMQNIS